MALVPNTIEIQIEALLTTTAELPPDQAKSSFKTQLAAIIVSAIQSATVTIPPGAVLVATAGSPTAQTGVNTAPAIGTLS